MPEWYGGAALGSGLGLPDTDHWKSQWARLQRWHMRVERIRAKSLQNELNAFDLDEVIAYFQNCYHLGDWLKVSRPDLKDSVKTFLENHLELRACRDICNGFKHKVISREPFLDPHFNLIREYDHFLSTTEPDRSPVSYRLGFADGDTLRKFDLFEFSETCFRLWEGFLGKDLGLAHDRS